MEATKIKRIEPGRMYSIPEAAEVVGVNESLIYRAASSGDLEHLRAGARQGIRVPGEALQRWVRSRWMAKPRLAQGSVKVDGAKVRDLRKKRGLSLDRLAQNAGIARSTLASIESRGPEASCKVETARSIADALGVKPRSIGERSR